MKLYKSNMLGVDLVTHLKAVQKVGLLMFDILTNKNISDYKDLRECVSKSCLLHDIGKVSEVFNYYIETNLEHPDFKKYKLFHHEISWAILSNVLNDYPEKYRDIILHSIYWHHPKHEIPKSKNKTESYSDSDSILSIISDKDKENIIEFYNQITGENVSVSSLFCDFNYIPKQTPKYIENIPYSDKFETNFLVNGILVSADRLVSSHDQYRILNNDEYCHQLINSLYKANVPASYKVPASYDIERFKLQEEYSFNSLKSKTSMIKLPAGGGKTITGLLAWINSKNNKTLMWVCPRNAVADSVYHSILDELSALNLKDVKVELYLAGSVVKKNYSNQDIKSNPDIIVTNIDNYLNPNVTNWVRDKMFSIMSCDVVFDEFHEFIGNEPLFALFLNMMRLRHKLCNSRTTLLSATPSILNYMWDNLMNDTLVLPSAKNHYKAAHNKKIKINFIDGLTSDNVKNNTLTVTNAIESAQKLAINNNYSIIAHSNYIAEQKEAILNQLYDLYGKSNKGYKENKVSVISAPIVQAAMDMSFSEISEIPSSPESTLQRLGRLNRWGEYDEATFNIVTNINSDIIKNETAAISNKYDNKLKNEWVEFLRQRTKLKGNVLTLDDVYEIYNDYLNINDNKRGINKFIRSKYEESTGYLSNIYPKRFIEDKSDNEINGDLEIDDIGIEEIKSKNNGSKMRKTDVDKVFCIYGYANTDRYTKPFSIDLNNVGDVPNENILLKIVKSLSADVSYNFDYKKHLDRKKDKFDSSYLKEIAWNEKTPFISFEKVYSDKYGIIKKELLKNIKYIAQ